MWSREGHIYFTNKVVLLADRQNISITMSRTDYKEPITLVISIIDDAQEKFYALLKSVSFKSLNSLCLGGTELKTIKDRFFKYYADQTYICKA